MNDLWLRLSATLLVGWASAASAEDLTQNPEHWFDRTHAALLAVEPITARATIETQDAQGGRGLIELEFAREVKDGEKRTRLLVHGPFRGGATYKMLMGDAEPLEKWVWLPTLRRVLKAADERRMIPFYDTEFVYEDLALAFPTERRGGSARFEERDGRRLVRLESPAYLGYERVVTWLDPNTAMPAVIEFYDREATLVRVQRWETVDEFSGGYFPKRIRSENPSTGAVSTLTFAQVDTGESG